MEIKELQVEINEEKIQETVRKSIEAFLASEQERMLSYHEFLWLQFKLVRKRWWFLQFLLLFVTGAALVSTYEEYYVGRVMGIMASFFVILIIPELWKNRSCRCMEIEEASYYSLRQIYSARMVLFGIVDVCLLTVFCGVVTMGLHAEFTELLVQFFLPMLVTACICFGTLCSRSVLEESTAILLCVLWCAVWMVITLQEKIYAAVTLPVWMACIGCSFGFLCFVVYRSLCQCGSDWEGNLDEIRIE